MSSVSLFVAMPALFTSTSRRPKVLCTVANRAITASSRVRSVGSDSASPPRALMPAATSSNNVSRRAANTVVAPSAANVSAIPRPIPLLAPVTIAILPRNCSLMLPLQFLDSPTMNSKWTSEISRACGRRHNKRGLRPSAGQDAQAGVSARCCAAMASHRAMPPPCLRLMIHKVGAAVQNRAVVDELEVARLEHHLQHHVGMVGDADEGAQRGFLFRVDGRVAALYGAAQVAVLEVAVEPAVFVNEARDVADHRRLAHAFGVGVGTAQDEALVEFFEQIGDPVQQHVVDRVRARDQAFTARLRHLQAEHGDDAELAARVGVRGLKAA